MEQESKDVFKRLEQLKVKPSETLKVSYFNSGGNGPSFVITDKIDGTFTLYGVSGDVLSKLQTANTIKALEAIVLPKLK